MTYQRDGLLLPPRTEQPVDAQLHEAWRLAHGDEIEVYDHLGPDADKKATLERRFLDSGRKIDVDLRPDALDEPTNEEIAEKITRLEALRADLVDERTGFEVAPDIRDAYIWKIDEVLANYFMLVAARQGDTEKFTSLNKLVYGEIDQDMYMAGLDWFAAEADKLAMSDQPAVAEAAARVRALLQGKRGYRELLLPEPEVFEAIRVDHWRPLGYYGLLLSGVDLPLEGKINNSIGDPALQQVLKNIQLPYRLADARGASWSIAHSSEEVLRPGSYNFIKKRFIGLPLGHEVGSHGLERVNGSRGPIALGEDGLDRHEHGNEGRALMREQVVYDDFVAFSKTRRWRDIVRRYVAIGFAEGVGEGSPKPFHEVYGLLNAIDVMYQAKASPDDAEKITAAAHERTWSLVTRVMKGTDGTGGAYLKDIVYLKGHVASWLTAALYGPEAIADGDLAKFDINNPRHIALLQKYGLLPERG